MSALDICGWPIHLDRGTVMGASVPQPFSGEFVASVGRLVLFSKRDLRVLVERLGGVFSPEITPRTTVIVSASHLVDPPPSVRRVLTEDEFCQTAGLPDLETLRSQYYAPKDLRAMYPALRDEHLRYLEKWGLI